jgi:hypothetical protein
LGTTGLFIKLNEIHTHTHISRYLLVQCFVNLTENGFPGVRHTIVTHGGLLVWSGVEQGDARALYSYLSGGACCAKHQCAIARSPVHLYIYHFSFLCH